MAHTVTPRTAGLGRVAFGYKDLALEDADLGIILIDTPGQHADYSGVWTGARFALVEHFGIRIEGITGEDGRWQLDFFPA